MKLKIVNVVAIAELASPLDLKQLAIVLQGSQFSKGGSWLKLYLKPEKYYIAFYKSGKFLITGVKSINEVAHVAKMVIDLLEKNGIMPKIEKLTVHNIVMVGSIRLNASLERIMFSIDTSKASYEPEQFPGLIFKDFGASFHLFPGGKFIVAGVRNEKSGEEAATKFRQMIERIC